MIQKQTLTDADGYTPKEMGLIIRAQAGAINELIDKVNACTSKLKEISTKLLKSDEDRKDIEQFIKTIDENA